MSTKENPYAVPESPPRFDAMSVYQESFFAVVWPSVAFSIFMLGLILFVELALLVTDVGRSLALNVNTEPWMLAIVGLVLPSAAYFMTASRLLRIDGQRRSIRRSLLIAVGVAICEIGATIASIALARVARGMLVEVNYITRTAISTTIMSVVYTLLLCVVFKLCWREIRLRRFVLVSFGTTALIIVIAFSHPSTPELAKNISLTFFSSILTLIAHCTCFAWWVATPTLEPETLQRRAT